MASSSGIEVERKFVVPDNYEEKIHQIGGTLLEELSFVDTYYDTKDLHLTRHNHWLRSRNDCWELKYPNTTKGGSTGKDKCTRYCETTDDALIVRLLGDISLPGFDAAQDKGLGELVGCHLQQLTRIETRRRSFLVRQCRIDVDVTDNGLRIGEIEKVVSDPLKVEEAAQAVEQLAEELGVSDQVPLGKLDVFLLKHHPELYGQLMEQARRK